jgi:hypothetical protein
MKRNQIESTAAITTRSIFVYREDREDRDEEQNSLFGFGILVFILDELFRA